MNLFPNVICLPFYCFALHYEIICTRLHLRSLLLAAVSLIAKLHCINFTNLRLLKCYAYERITYTAINHFNKYHYLP